MPSFEIVMGKKNKNEPYWEESHIDIYQIKSLIWKKKSGERAKSVIVNLFTF